MSGAWAKGANKAVATAPPEGGFQTVGGDKTKNRNNNGGRNSTNNSRRSTTQQGQLMSPNPNSSNDGSSKTNTNNSRRRSSANAAGNNNSNHLNGNNNNNDEAGGGRGRGRGGGGGGGGRTGPGGGRGRGGGSGGGGRGGRSHDNPNNSSGQRSHQHNNNTHKRSSQQESSGTSNNNNSTNNNNNAKNSSQGGTHEHVERIIIKDVQLLDATGIGSTPSQRAVRRITAKQFIMVRTQYLQPPDDPTRFQPHSECHWKDAKREEEIQALCSKVMELGDVSKNKPNSKKAQNDTAPPIEECKPLEVNEETRWKSKAMATAGGGGEENDGSVSAPTSAGAIDTTEEIVGKALLILNKISWTTLERLAQQFLEQTGLAENEAVRVQVIEMLIRKAQTEPHFGPMYAELCAVISRQFKPFKKELLLQCQREFEIDTAHKIANATVGMTDPHEIGYHSLIIRKAYVGHITFLGELYLRDVVKLSIMMYCLDELLKGEGSAVADQGSDDKASGVVGAAAVDEENLECFAHLMTTMGEKLDSHAKQNKKPFDWDKVVELRNSPQISSRIKFLLQDLLELKERGWVKRRKEEKAKTIADIHKEVAKEEQAAKMMNRRHSSNVNLRRSTSLAAAAASSMDDDGFLPVSRTPMKKVGSKQSMGGENTASPFPSIPKAGELRRSQSQPVGLPSIGGPSNNYTIQPPTGGKPSFVSNTEATSSGVTISHHTMPVPQKEGPSEEDCEKRTKAILKEYFVGGDIAEAVLSIHELVHVGKEGSIERGAKVVEAGTLMVMEMKEVDVHKLVEVMGRCVRESKIETESIIKGLNTPLDLLSDIEIDAPLAGRILAIVIARYIESKAITLDILKDAPAYFLSDGKPAAFAVKVVKIIGEGSEEGPSGDDLEIVGALMTEDDRAMYSSAKAMFDAA